MSAPPPPLYTDQDLEWYYDYLPNVGANAFFTALFFVIAVVYLVRAVRAPQYTTWIMFVFAASETAGYAARVAFAKSVGDLWSLFLAQLIILIIAPNLAQAYLYSTTGKLIQAAPISSKYVLKRRSRWIAVVFICADLVCLIIQSVAGSQLADQSLSESQQNAARTVMLVGLALQLACLAVYTCIVYWFLFVCPRSCLRRVRRFIVALTLGVALIVVRNVYRVAEFSEGSFTQGTLQRKEVYYFLGDTIPMALVCVLFIVVDVADPAALSEMAKAAADESSSDSDKGAGGGVLPV